MMDLKLRSAISQQFIPLSYGDNYNCILLYYSQTEFYPQNVFTDVVQFWEQTSIFSWNVFNQLILLTQTLSVYSAVITF